jgi:glycosyltransferase A (GT-A) superfamily protein (DUF2064 family)
LKRVVGRLGRIATLARGAGAGHPAMSLARIFRNLPPGPAVIATAAMTPIAQDTLREALRTVTTQDVVLGPNEDGGYWLVGLGRRRRFPSGMFQRVRWSREDMLDDTLARLPLALLKIELLAMEDVPRIGARRR